MRLIPDNFRVHTLVAFGVAFVNMLEQGGTLLTVKVGRVGARQASVQNVFNARRTPAPPGRVSPHRKEC